MLIDFTYLFSKYSIKPKGIVHIGANRGEEFQKYISLGLRKQIWIEANPKIYPLLQSTVASNPQAITINCAIGDEDKDAILHESNNGSQSSSILELGTHKIAHPEVHYIGDIPVKMHRLESVISETMIQEYDFLNIDVQGFEGHVLKGMENYLKYFKWAYLEVNKAELYKGCMQIDEMDKYLGSFGFKRVETKWENETGWGDALFIKQ